MKLNKIRLGDYLELYSEKCGIPDLKKTDVSGINKKKEFFEPSLQVGGDTTKYKIVPPNYFACNLMHVGRDRVLPIAVNRTKTRKIVSPAYTVFKLSNEKTLLIDYLFMLVNSAEKDRYFWFHCDSSIRDGMDWSAFCDMEFFIPSIEVQKKIVSIYNAVLTNIEIYTNDKNVLKNICDYFIENLKKNEKHMYLNEWITEYSTKNTDLSVTLERGVGTKKCLIIPKAKASNLRTQKICYSGDFVFATNTARNADKLSIAYNNEADCVVSPTYCTFKISNKLDPHYLNLWFQRSEFDRYVRFHSWGSVREMFYFDDLANYKIPIPTMEVQKSIANIYKLYETRISWIKRLNIILDNICPILIKGSTSKIDGGLHNV